MAAVLRGSKIEAAAVVEDDDGPDRVVEHSFILVEVGSGCVVDEEG
jgi:hypothetical protein